MRRKLYKLLVAVGFCTILAGCTVPEHEQEAPTVTSTNAPTSTPSSTPSNTPTPTPSPIPTNTSIPTPSPTPTSTPTPTSSPTPTNTPTPTLSPTPTNTPTPTPSPTPTSTPTPTTSPIPTSTPTPTPLPEGAIITSDGTVLTEENIDEYRDNSGFLAQVMNPISEFKEGNDELVYSCPEIIIINKNYIINFETLCTEEGVAFNWYLLSVTADNPEIIDVYISGNGDNYIAGTRKPKRLLQYVAELVPLKNGTTTLTCTLYNKDTNEIYDIKTIEVTVKDYKEKSDPYILRTTKIAEDIYCNFYSNGYLYIEGTGATKTFKSGYLMTESFNNDYIVPKKLADSITHVIVSEGITKFDIAALNGLSRVEYLSFSKGITLCGEGPGCGVATGTKLEYYKNGEFVSEILELEHTTSLYYYLTTLSKE